jgi:hypothetical protein
LNDWDAGRFTFAGEQLTLRWLEMKEAARVAATEFNTQLPGEDEAPRAIAGGRARIGMSREVRVLEGRFRKGSDRVDTPRIEQRWPNRLRSLLTLATRLAACSFPSAFPRSSQRHVHVRRLRALHNPGCSRGLNPPVSSRLLAM